MLTWQELWPPYGVRLTEGDLELKVLTDDDIPGLVELALEGLHDPDEMPFYQPWTQVPPEVLPADMVRHYSMLRANLAPSHLELPFAVRVRGKLVGMQSIGSVDFAVTRTAETGSWLGRRFQGRGIGTRMRRVVCAFAFDGLNAAEVTSSAFLDNPASLAVSRKVGYRPNGVVRLRRRPEEVALNQRLVLTPDTFVRGPAVRMTGVPALLRFLDLDPSDPSTAALTT
jgi:RimJ/RimL family protein N-acetyltransferase